MAEFTNELMKWLGGGHSPWHTVDMAAHWLTERGFEPLALNRPFSVHRGGRYFVENGTFLAAVTVGQKDVIRIAAAHTDWPCMRGWIGLWGWRALSFCARPTPCSRSAA